MGWGSRKERRVGGEGNGEGSVASSGGAVREGPLAISLVCSRETVKLVVAHVFCVCKDKAAGHMQMWSRAARHGEQCPEVSLHTHVRTSAFGEQCIVLYALYPHSGIQLKSCVVHRYCVHNMHHGRTAAKVDAGLQRHKSKTQATEKVICEVPETGY